MKSSVLLVVKRLTESVVVQAVSLKFETKTISEDKCIYLLLLFVLICLVVARFVFPLCCS